MSLLICTPMFGGKCDREFFNSCLELQRELTRIGMTHDFLTVANESLITRGRNKMAASFLEMNYEALLFLDADLEFSPADVAALWNLEKPVAGGCYSRKAPGEVPKVWQNGAERLLSSFNEPFTADRLATGFLMIRREALETLRDRSSIVDYDEQGQCWEFFNTPIKEGWTTRDGVRLWQDRYMLSEDYYFSDLWVKAGGELWTDPKIRLKHWGRMAF